MGLLSACGQSRYQTVIPEDVFAPAYKVDDQATAEVQTLFTDQPETSKATYSRTSQTTNGGTASTAGVSASSRAEPVVTRPRVLPVSASPKTRYNCAVAPTTQEQFAAYQHYCTNLLRPSTQAQVAAQPTPANAPSRPVFVARSFNCTMEPQNKAELTFFRARCLAAVAAPIKAPVYTQVAARPTTVVAPAVAVAPAAPQGADQHADAQPADPTASPAGHGRQPAASATDGASSGSCAVFHEFGSAAPADRQFSALDRQLKQHRQRASCASRTGGISALRLQHPAHHAGRARAIQSLLQLSRFLQSLHPSGPVDPCRRSAMRPMIRADRDRGNGRAGHLHRRYRA